MNEPKLYIGGKACPSGKRDPTIVDTNQTQILREAGFKVYEAVIISSEDWKALELEVKQGLFPISLDIKGKEQEQRWKELSDRLNLLNDLGKSNPLGALYVSVDGFPEKIERLNRLNYEYKAIETMPATSPASLEAKTCFPENLFPKARLAGAKILVDVCHLFQSAVYQEAKLKPLEVLMDEEGDYHTQIPVRVVEKYYNLVREIANSGYLAPFAHTNGHIFVADQRVPKQGETDQRIHLPNGRVLQCFGEKSPTLEDWGSDKTTYEYYSYALPIIVGGQLKIAQWFRSHTFVTESRNDEIYSSALDATKSTQQLIKAGVKVLILENNKENVEKLRKEARFFLDAVS